MFAPKTPHRDGSYRRWRDQRCLFTVAILLMLGGMLSPLAGPARATVRQEGQPSVYLPLVGNAPASTTPPNPSGNSDLGFRPNPNGFNFENWGEEADNTNDMGMEDLIRLFGRNQVCRSADGTCVLDAAAQTWIQKQIEGMNGGHCEGMAVLSLHLFKGLDFKGKKLPSDFMPGATSTFALDKASVRNAVSYYFVTQALEPVAAASSATRSKKPSEILQLMRASFNGGSELYTLGIYQRSGSGGHAITPYKVEDKGNNITWVYVYDNNYPNQERYIEFNTAADTWIYKGAATNPGTEASDYEGDAGTQSLDLTPLSLRDNTMQCPFCGTSSLSVAGTRAAAAPIQVFFTGEGSLVLTNANGQQIGWDGTKNINTLPNAYAIPFKDDLGHNIPPTFQIPTSDKPYNIVLGGKTITREVDADLVMSGDHFTVGMENIKVDPGETLDAKISPNGRQLVFKASSDAETPDLFMAIDPADPKNPGYIFNIGGFELEAGKTVTMTIDPDKGQLFIDDDDGNADQYDIEVQRITDAGTKIFKRNDFSVPAGDDARIDFGTWNPDNGDNDMEFRIDDEGNGDFDDDEPIDEPNQP